MGEIEVNPNRVVMAHILYKVIMVEQNFDMLESAQQISTQEWFWEKG